MMSDLEAKRIVDSIGEPMGLSPIERLAVRLVAKHETQNGAGWDAQHKPAPRPELGAGSNNMGAITTTSTIPGNFFVHTDSRFDAPTGKVITYETKFSRHSTPEGGFIELAQTLLFKNGARRGNVANAMALGSLLELATAMRMNRYFLGIKPMAEAIEDYRSALERRYQEIQTSTGEDYFNDPKAAPGSPAESGSAPESHFSPSVPRSLQQLSASLPVLRRGVQGDLVGVLQFELGLDPDEIFGPRTQGALVAFQQTNQIAHDTAHGQAVELGACGPKTWAALFTLKPLDADMRTAALDHERDEDEPVTA
jgi:peptidoglycan hydrolase-like protein with peptidoglycan-binding domain